MAALAEMADKNNVKEKDLLSALTSLDIKGMDTSASKIKSGAVILELKGCANCNSQSPKKKCSKRHAKCENKFFCDSVCEKAAHVLKKETVNYKLSAIEGKGMGMIASRDIKIGELVLSEDPVLKYESSTNEENCLELLNTHRCKFPMLPNHTQREVMSLYCNQMEQEKTKNYVSGSFPPEFIQFASICRINSFRIKDKSARYAGLYLLAARFNHSCLSNITWYFKGSTMKFKANSQITKGDELTISYVGPLNLTMPPTIQEMRSHFVDNWYFDCICELCCSEDKHMQKEIETHRVKYWMLCKEYGKLVMKDVSGLQCCLRLGKDIITEMKLARVHEVYNLKGRAEYCYKIANKCKDDEMAKYFAEKEREATMFMT